MKQRQLGKNGPKVSALGLGCMGMTGFYGEADESLATHVVQRAYEEGVTFFDTADMYGNGANEILLGQAIKTFRNKIVLATKCAIEFDGVTLKVHNSPEYILEACDASLKRLQTDVIDVFYLHRFSGEMPIENSVQAMIELINKGKIRYVGLSEVDSETLKKAHAVLGDKLVALQSEFSILNHKDAEAILPTCRKLGISFVAFSPLGRGLLPGKQRNADVFFNSKALDVRAFSPQFQRDTFPHNLHLVDALQPIANKKKSTTSQLSLAWLLSKGEDIIPIPGTKRMEYLIENLKAVDVSLSDSDLLAIDNAIQSNPIQGVRLP
jgi:aryl-alcohol dehydrogenase-like predicted oxidoreductase